MGVSFLSRVVIVALLGVATLLGCGGPGPVEEGVAEDHGGPEGEELMVNRIAYVDNSGDLLVVDPDGGDEKRLTGDVRVGLLSQVLEAGDSYAWPTWSHDGARIAASRVSLAGGNPGLSVQVFDLDSGAVSVAYENDLPAPVADGTPHYIYWSPDDRYLSFLAPTPEGLTSVCRRPFLRRRTGRRRAGGGRFGGASVLPLAQGLRAAGGSQRRPGLDSGPQRGL